MNLPATVSGQLLRRTKHTVTMASSEDNDALSNAESSAPLVEEGHSPAAKKTTWHQRSLNRIKKFKKVSFPWTKQIQEFRGRKQPGESGEQSKALVRANQVWTWLKAENPLPPPKPPKPKRTYPREDIHREDSIWVRDPKDVGAQIWEWIIAENPIKPKAPKAPKQAQASPANLISKMLPKNSGKALKSNTLRTAWVWLKGDNPLGPPKAKKVKMKKEKKQKKKKKSKKLQPGAEVRTPEPAPAFAFGANPAGRSNVDLGSSRYGEPGVQGIGHDSEEEDNHRLSGPVQPDNISFMSNDTHLPG